ncbi:MAG TPA: caspase family protein, partial [Kofleriaceae bacterium]
MVEPARTRDADDGTQSVNDLEYKPGYDDRWAVLIGINRYLHHNKLLFAAADAVAMARTLIEQFRFPTGNVFLVVNDIASLPDDLATWLAGVRPKLWISEQATQAVIKKLLITELPGKPRRDDCVLIYFAGHGRSRRGSVNPKPFLIPEDAASGAWDE